MDGHLNKTPHNEAVSRNTGDFRERSFTKPFNNKGKEKKQQVKPALRLPADRYASKIVKHQKHKDFVYLITNLKSCSIQTE